MFGDGAHEGELGEGGSVERRRFGGFRRLLSGSVATRGGRGVGEANVNGDDDDDDEL